MTDFSSSQRSNRKLKRILLLAFIISLTSALFSSHPEFFFNKSLIANLATGSESRGRVLAPDFCLTDVEGSEFCLEDFRGKVVVIDFMATWCVACEDQAVQLREVHESFGGKELVFISIDVDVGESPAQLKSFKEYVGAKWRFAVDTSASGVGLKYGSKYLPTLYVIDRNGFIAWTEKGITDATTLTQLLSQYV